MSVYVIDASVAVKWMLPEPDSDLAVRLQSPTYELHAPAFIEIELASVLWKKLRQKLLNREDADDLLQQVPNFPLTRHADAALVSDAFDIAHRADRSVYDCMYVALAIKIGGRTITADDRLVNSLAGTPWAAFVLHLRHI